MTSSANAPTRGPREAADPGTGSSTPLMVVLGWLVPGAAHIAQGHLARGAIFLAAIMAMFGCGLAFGGRIFPLQLDDPLIALAAIAQWGLGLPRMLGGMFGWGPGIVTAATYEYGNTFLIAGGLLNTLVVLDAYDIATGRRLR